MRFLLLGAKRVFQRPRDLSSTILTASFARGAIKRIMHGMTAAVSILLLLAVVFFVVLRFVRSRFHAVSDLPDCDLPDPDLPDSDLPNNGPDGPNLGSPALLRGGPKKKISNAEVEEPDDS